MKRPIQRAKQQGVTTQHHQILWLPQKKPLMIDLRHILNNSEHTAPASKSHSAMCDTNHVKRHLACVEQQDSPSNVTSHEKWLSCSHRKRQQCEEQQHSSSNVTKYCTCHKTVTLRHPQSHEKRQYDVGHTFIWNAIYNAVEQQYPPSNVTKFAPPTKMTLMIDPPHIGNVNIARSNSTHLPTSAAPATKKRHSDITKATTSDSTMCDTLKRIYNAWSNGTHLPTSPNLRLPGKWVSWLILLT